MLREVSTKYGKIKGLPGSDPRVTSFKGIPFAKPPVGELRWHAPEQPEAWEKPLEAYAFKAISVQDRPGLGTDLYCREWHVDSGVEIDEDCLYLNVWTPANRTDEKLPVFVWYFGGGFQWGYPSEMEFDGEKLARRGIVVVSVNYRLNVFGFLTHREITAENPEKPANFGLLDQQAGTRWVKENIAAFGGDPENITIGGQSAGGGSVMAQLTNLDNKGLFQRAIIMSGAIDSPYDKFGFPKHFSLEEGEKYGEDFFAFLGVKNLSEARKLDSSAILTKYNEFIREHGRIFGVRDNRFVKGEWVKLLTEGLWVDVPVMAGNTADEFLNAIQAKDEEELAGKAKEIFGGNADVFLKYPESRVGGENGWFAPVSGIEITVKMLFEEFKRQGSRNNFYYYRFNPDIPGEDNPGTFHSCDLWFFFESIAKCSRPYTGRHFDLARLMCNYWANFMKNGDPNGVDRDGTRMPLWEPYTEEGLHEMEFTGKGPVLFREDHSEFKRFLKEAVRDRKKRGVPRLQAYNPYLPSYEFVPDGEPYVFGDRVYVYGSHDFYGGEVFCMGDYVCWSADVNDLGNWRYEGVIYSKYQEPGNEDGQGMLYAPDVTIGPDGRYYLYYVISNKGNVSVAVCDTPAGKYEFIGYVRYADGTPVGAKQGDEPQFDPGVLTEGDVTYLYTGFCGHGDKGRHGAMGMRLDRDMLTVLEGPVFVAPGCEYSKGTGYEGHEYFEAASVRKVNGKYVFVYSGYPMHELCYAVSDKPLSDFKYGGVLISNCDLGIDTYKPSDMVSAFGANNHGSIIEINGQWYVFYHRHTNGTWYSRQVCAERLELLPGGEVVFRQAEITSCGLNNGPLKGKGYYPTYIACHLFNEKDEEIIRKDNSALLPDSKKVRIIKDGRDDDRNEGYVTGCSAGTVVGFKYFEFEKVSKITVSLRGYGNGDITVHNAWDGPALGSGHFTSMNNWGKVEIPVEFPDGVSALYFKFSGWGNLSFRDFVIQ